MNLTVVILAAGQGTRMRSDLPKVIHPVAGRPMVGYVLDAAQALGPRDIAVVVGHGADLVRQALGDGVSYATQATRLGTGHAVQQAEQVVSGRANSVLVLYGDTPLIRMETLHKLVDQHEAAGAAATLLTFRPQDPTGYGRILRDPETGQVRAIIEEADASPDQRQIDETSGGIFCFRDQWLWPNLASLEPSESGEFYLTDLVALADRQGETVATYLVPDPAEPIGLDNRLKMAWGEAEMRRRINGRWLLSGVTMVDPETTYVDAGVEIGSDTILWPGSLLQGNTRIGRGCTIGPGSVIRDSEIGDRCRVELSVVEQAVMEEGSDVGPFGHLRKGARLGAGAHMGNFGEIKNSYLGPGAKMGHMSYLGDATVGAGANIGAGTITCNYDGKQKHATIIGDDAFIGSDTMLVAPVEIGDGARTGAGSVVTHDVPAGGVAWGVPARVRSEPDVQEPEGE